MSEFTIFVDAGFALTLTHKKQGCKCKLWYQGAGIAIYVSGKPEHAKQREPEIRNLALQKASEMHIPMMSFKDVRVRSSGRKRKVAPEQIKMF